MREEEETVFDYGDETATRPFMRDVTRDLRALDHVALEVWGKDASTHPLLSPTEAMDTLREAPVLPLPSSRFDILSVTMWTLLGGAVLAVAVAVHLAKLLMAS